MQDSYPFNVYSGLLEPGHRKRIGSALWEFLWCIDKTTKEIPDDTGDIVGLVLGGKPINLSEISRDLGIDRSTVLRNLGKLEDEGYVGIIRAPYGLILKVRNSKKRRVAIMQPPPNINQSPVAEMQPSPNIYQSSVAKMQQPLQICNERCENANSNKDLSFDFALDSKKEEEAEDASVPVSAVPDISAVGIPPPQHGADPAAVPETDADSGRVTSETFRRSVVDKYLRRKGKGFDISPKDEMHLAKIMNSKIPLETVLEGIDKAFDEFIPAHALDEIRSLNFCLPKIFDLHTRKVNQSTQDAFEAPAQPAAEYRRTNPNRSRAAGGAPRKPVIPIAGNKPGRGPLSETEIQAIIDKASKWDKEG